MPLNNLFSCQEGESNTNKGKFNLYFLNLHPKIHGQTHNVKERVQYRLSKEYSTFKLYNNLHLHIIIK